MPIQLPLSSELEPKPKHSKVNTDKLPGIKDVIGWSPEAMIDWAIKEYNPPHALVLFSGGHDSLVAMHSSCEILKAREINFKVVHLNTGIGIEATRIFVRKTVDELELPFAEYHAKDYTKLDGTPDPQDYEEICLRWGFPGPVGHSLMYQRLKERSLRMAIRDLKRSPKDKTVLISGVRAPESIRRTKHTRPYQLWENTKLYIAPIWNYTKEQVNQYIEEHNLERNEVADLLHGSKECLCGAYAHPGELDEICQWYPAEGQRLLDLQEKVKEAGFEWGWEEAPPKEEGKQAEPVSSPLCSQCAFNFMNQGE